MTNLSVAAVDLGAESGRVMAGRFDGSRITLDESYRFINDPVWVGDTLYWDSLRLWNDIKAGLRKVGDVSAIGVDTWGVNLALLDKNGQLIANPVHYRDNSTDGMMEWVFERMPRRDVFEQTGIQFMQINGVYWLASLTKNQAPVLEIADTLLTIADLFNYWLSGSKTCEFTHLTTTQLYNPTQGDWAYELVQAIGVSTDILPPIVQPGTTIGKYEGVPVIAPACHDTGSAVIGVPTTTENYAYLSSGTWSLLGVEVDKPVINDATYAANLTNEGGYDGTFRLLKNIMGLWIAQQCRRTWEQAGQSYSYEELTPMAEAAEPFRSFIDPDLTVFLKPGDMPSRIREYCQQTGQPIPETHGQIIRCVYESLALKYRLVLDMLIEASGRIVDKLHIIGGGVQNQLLCQMTANAIGRPVIAGPIEATAMGNVMVQLIAQGELANIAEARAMLSQSVAPVEYQPQATDEWEAQIARYKELIATPIE